jgi:hypothetical protein
MPTEGRMRYRPGGLVDAGRKADANQRIDADQKAGRCRPEGWSMPTGRVDAMPTRRVDAHQQGRCYGEFRYVRKSRNVKQSELRKKPGFRKTPERRTVGGLTHPENTETPKPRPEHAENTEEPELPTRSETPKVGLERQISGNLDVRKKESRRPMRNRRPERMSKTGSRNQAARHR